MTYYNENEPKAAAWLRELIAEGHIAPGYVDQRSIIDVRPHELTPYAQQHFFAGIGGWSLALRLAGWSDERPVRTGSCPCQPFSIAGQGLGTKDERHLWPHFRDLITFGEPTVTFGEQVASPDGREWLAGVRADLEGLGYEVGAADLCAAGVGSPHPRQRLYWMANPGSPRCAQQRRERLESARSSEGGESCGMVLPNGAGRHEGRQGAAPAGHGRSAESAGGHGVVGLANGERTVPPAAALSRSPWSSFDVLQFRDLDKRGNRKLRRIESGTFPLAHGVSGRVGLLRGYGNAIVPQVAAAFIQASLEAIA